MCFRKDVEILIRTNSGGIVDFNRVVEEIDAEIARLQQARAALTGKPATRGPGRPKTATITRVAAAAAPKKSAKRKRRLSPEGRKRIADAMRKRWAERRKQQGTK